MTKKRVFTILIIIIGLGLVYVDYRFHRAYKNIEGQKEKLGYNTPCKSLT